MLDPDAVVVEVPEAAVDEPEAPVAADPPDEPPPVTMKGFRALNEVRTGAAVSLPVELSLLDPGLEVEGWLLAVEFAALSGCWSPPTNMKAAAPTPTSAPAATRPTINGLRERDARLRLHLGLVHRRGRSKGVLSHSMPSCVSCSPAKPSRR